MRLLSRFLLVSVVAFAGLAAPAPASAGDECSSSAKAESQRLQGELRSLAQRNAHAGVDRAYRELVKLGCPIAAVDHTTGGTASRSLGDIASARARLRAAGDTSGVADLDRRFSSVVIAKRGKKERALALTSAMPFEPDARAAIERAQKEVTDTGAFNGYLPLGSYTVGSKSFEVKAGGQVSVAK